MSSISKDTFESLVRLIVVSKHGYTFADHWGEDDNKALYALVSKGSNLVTMCPDLITAVLEHDNHTARNRKCVVYEWRPGMSYAVAIPSFTRISPKRMDETRTKIKSVRSMIFLQAFFKHSRDYLARSKARVYLADKMRDVVLCRKLKTRLRVVQYLAFMRCVVSHLRSYMSSCKACSYCRKYRKKRLLCSRCRTAHFCDEQVHDNAKSVCMHISRAA